MAVPATATPHSCIYPIMARQEPTDQVRRRGGAPCPRRRPDSFTASAKPSLCAMQAYGSAAPALLENGYEPLPIKPNSKTPAVARWTSVQLSPVQIDAWAQSHANCGVGLRTGRLVGLDIDILEPDDAHRIARLAEQRFGPTLMRVGLWPKRLMLYRTEVPFAKVKAGSIEVLGHGQQFVAFGRHPDTGTNYYWPDGETPLEVALDRLPYVDQKSIEAFVAEAVALLPETGALSGSRDRTPRVAGSCGPVRNDAGLVVDGRDAWLSSIAFHAVHDATDRGDQIDKRHLTERVWGTFADSADLQRPRQDGMTCYGPEDALRKVRDKLRLHKGGRLPSRQNLDVEADYVAPKMTVDEARGELHDALRSACGRILAWHKGESSDTLPVIGIRATVGLGKSSASREHLLALLATLREMDAPHRILVFTPSHVLAEETAMAWAELGSRVAVLRGYERLHPLDRTPMCRDVEMVKAAIAAGLDPQGTVCVGRDGSRCPFFAGCRKQANRNEVQAADIVIAPYDALYTGFAVDPESIGLIVVDEGCWSRAIKRTVGLTVESLTTERTGDLGIGMNRNWAAGRIADRLAFRAKLQAAMTLNGPGDVTRAALKRAGLTEEDCDAAILLERRLLEEPGLAPGMSPRARERAFGAAKANERTFKIIALWKVARTMLAGGEEPAGNSGSEIMTPTREPAQ